MTKKWKFLLVFSAVTIIGLFLGELSVSKKIVFFSKTNTGSIVNSVSDIPARRVAVKNEQKIVEFVKNSGIMTTGTNLRDAKKPKKIPKQIIFHLVSQKQKWEIWYENDQIADRVTLMSSGAEFDEKNILHVFVYMNFESSFWAKQNFSKDTFFTFQALRTIFGLSHPPFNYAEFDKFANEQIFNLKSPYVKSFEII